MDEKSGEEFSTGEGRYANYFQVGHNKYEFLVDVGQQFQNEEMPHVYLRIVTNPSYAKALWQTLGDSVRQFEQHYGDIAALSGSEE
jgi:hypothetical protein